jgi:hypothetical protein
MGLDFIGGLLLGDKDWVSDGASGTFDK